MRSYYIPGFPVAFRCTKDDKTDEASAFMELTLKLRRQTMLDNVRW